ncbi:CBS domain-containing protein [Desmospora profundinema]|uniref:Transcriptional regulator n=1 Tax=Desmospora profundinema TaxID=1571184 RepID=A0ABU1IPL2_9BACL|nr:CBS domain-containing protein [Desmospora profundinema]MDR6225884.1 putative transcriptional regulator [Desmospora profundinema]
MLIKNCMTPRDQLTMVRTTSTMEQVVEQLRKKGLDSIPVLDEKNGFAGITGYGSIMKQILKNGWAREEMDRQPISQAVEKVDPLTVDSDFEALLPTLIRYPFVPIVEADGVTLVGIAKISDVESAMAQALGAGVRGVRFLIGVFVDVPHILERLLQILKPFDVNIVSMATFDAGDPAARRILLKVTPTPQVEAISKSLDRSGFRVLSAHLR